MPNAAETERHQVSRTALIEPGIPGGRRAQTDYGTSVTVRALLGLPSYN